MTVQVKEFVQTHWETAGVNTFREGGDFYSIDGYMPTPDRRGLQRAPAWTARQTSVGFTEIRGAFWDHENATVVFVGTNGSSHLSACNAPISTWSFSAITELSTATSNAGGLIGRNYAWWGGDLYVIGADKKVYRGSAYDSALAAFYSTADAQILAPYGDRMYMVTEGGDIKRLNDADNAFEAHYTPVGDLDIRYLCGYRNYLYAVSQDLDGTLYVLRVDSASASTPAMEVVGHLQVPGDVQQYGCPFAQHDDRLYFSPGVQTTPVGYLSLSIYAYRYTESGHIDFVSKFILDPDDLCSLVVWQDELWLVRMNVSSGGYHQLHVIDQHALPKQKQTGTFRLAADTFVRPFVCNAGGYLVLASNTNDVDTTGPGHNLNTSATFQSAYLDMGHPGKDKRLNSITVLLDGKCGSNSTYTLKYRFDDTAAWSTAGTATSTRKIEVTDIGGTFQQMQVRVVLAGPAATDDRAIERLSIVYTIDL
jgi:hypothetical protein